MFLKSKINVFLTCFFSTFLLVLKQVSANDNHQQIIDSFTEGADWGNQVILLLLGFLFAFSVLSYLFAKI